LSGGEDSPTGQPGSAARPARHDGPGPRPAAPHGCGLSRAIV